MSFIDSQLARLLLSEEEKKQEGEATLQNESQKYIKGYIPEEPKSASGSKASGRINQDLEPESGVQRSNA
jgi:hypothetical protein